MAVKITPRGTRGLRIPKLPGPVMKLLGAANLLVRRLGGMPIVELTTVGAKTGQRRTVHVRRFDVDSDTWMVVASLGGAAQHPAWYYNMAKNPDQVWVEIDGEQVHVTPTSLHGAEREAAWARIVAEASGFADYQAKTDREIPVVVLRRVEQGAGGQAEPST